MGLFNFTVPSALIQQVSFGTDVLEMVLIPFLEGALSKTFEIRLKRNALVRTYDIVVKAAAATQVPAGVAGQIRTSSKGSGQTGVVVDFGAPRTVTAVRMPEGLGIVEVSPWIGSGFARNPVFSSTSGGNFARLPSEIKTERIEVVVTGTVEAAELGAEMRLLMPDLPAGIEVRVNEGPPVFSHPGVVQPGQGDELSDGLWNAKSERVVHLAAELAKQTGDPFSEEEMLFRVSLTARSPGVLGISASTQDVSYIRRATFDGTSEKELPFANEGQMVLPLDSLPTGLQVQEVRFQASATVPGVRVQPATGPEAGGQAAIALTPERAIILRLNPAAGLGELTALRVPLRSEGGAEARVVLWSNVSGALQPEAPIDKAVSAPLTISAQSGNAAADWVTFEFRQPVEIPAEGLWAAVTVNRGSVEFEFGGPQAGAGQVLWGSPSGPWRNLPAALAGATGRSRVAGTVRAGSRIDPYQVAVGTVSAGFLPNPRGAAATLAVTPAVAQAGPVELRVTSFVPARLTLRDVEVVSAN